MRKRKLRLHQDSFSRRWTVQGWFPDAQVWGDIGDPFEDRRDAERRLNELDGRS
jgi:hypothetical protein